MTYTPSHIYSLYTPSVCPRRVYLRANNVPEAEPGPFEKLIEELGVRHEQNHLSTFEEYTDLSKGSIERRFANTMDAANDKADIIHQGELNLAPSNTLEVVIGIPNLRTQFYHHIISQNYPIE
jgi:hypothetical protein